MKTTNRISIRFYIILIIAGLLTLYLWPLLVVARPLTAKHQLERAWQLANQVAGYTYQTRAIQTIHPAAQVENVGRRVETERIDVEGRIDRPAESMRLDLWPSGKANRQVIALKIEDGLAYGRLQADAEWTALDAPPTDLFAPGGDPLGFLAAATNIRESTHDESADSFDPLALSFADSQIRKFSFDLNGLQYARFMRSQLEEALRRKGELPPGISLDLSRQYVDMIGHGEIWVNADGLPVRQIVKLKFPPDRQAMEWVEADITTEFGDWQVGGSSQGFLPLVRSWWNNSTGSIHHSQLGRIGLILGFFLLFAGITCLVLIYRRSPVVYGALAGAMLISMLGMPLIQANQARAFSQRQQVKVAEYEQQQANQQTYADIRAELAGQNFNPRVDPRQNPPAHAPQQEESSVASLGRIALPAQQATLTATTAYTTGYDSDGDSLTDEVEILELGTDPDDIDTDGDGISDGSEVTGFNLNGSQWYLNPLSMDSNGDGMSDLAACPDLGDVDENGDLQTPAGSSCDDTDGDGVPNAFDFDNDADGVPNSVDISPNLIHTLSTTAQDALTFNLSAYQTDAPILAEFQIRPPDETHLWYTNNYLDWPDQDTGGQIMRVTNDTLSDKGDILLTPMLEIEIPYSAANPSRGLPITDTVDISTITATTPFTTWVDQATLDLYSISLTQDEDDGTLYAYVPLVMIEDRVGDMPVAWGGRMYYVLDGDSSGWGEAHNVRLLWMVLALTDFCDPGENDYDTYCAPDSGNWVSQSSVLQTYYEDFTLTGLAVKEDYGMETAIVAQNEAAITDYENYLWVLSHHLQDTFLAASLVTPGDTGSRFDIAEIERRFQTGSAASDTERWQIPATALDVSAVYTYSDQISGLADMLDNQIPDILADNYPGAAVDRQVNLLVAREETYRSAVWGSGTPVSVNGAAITVDLSLPEKRTFSSIKWTPYIYDGTGWNNTELVDYLADLENNLGSAIDLAEVLDGATVADAALTRQGAISFLKSYYLTLYQGLTALTEVDDVPASSDALVDTDFLLNGESAEKIVLDDTLGLMLAYFENEASQLLDGQAYADEALRTFSNPVNLLETMGAVDTGTIRLASEQLGGALSEYVTKKIFKLTNDIHGTKTKYGKYSAKTAGAVTVIGVATMAGLYKASNGSIITFDEAMVGAYGTFTAAASFDVVAAVGALHKFKTAKYLITELDLLWDIKQLSKFNALSGFLLESSLAVGMTLFTGFSQNLWDTEPTAYALVAEAIAQVVVAVVMAVLALHPIGALVSAVVGLIDSVIGLLCESNVIDAGETADSWICDGLSGALTKALTYFFNDYTPLVDMEHENRLDIVINEPTITQKTDAGGFVEGNQLDVSVVITTSLYMGSPNWMGYLYDGQWDDDTLEEASFSYLLQESETDISLEAEQTSWDIPAGRSPIPAVGIPEGKRFYQNFQANRTVTLGSPGINQGVNLYLSEGFNVPAQNCWFIIGPNCWIEEYDDTSHIDMSESLVFDIFPNTLAGFRELTAVGNDSYRLAWHNDFYAVLVDADNDGLRSKNSGGPDPNDSQPDSDFDGLSDLFEYQNGSSLTEADADCDGLTDYWETFYNTDPNQSDTDNDGLADGEEMFHPNKLYPYENSAPTNANPPACSSGVDSYTGGWSIVYDYTAAGQPLTTWVSADPNDADPDDDNINDSREKIYGYNPNLARQAKILSLSSLIESDSGHTPYVAPGGQIDYTAAISNELDNRYAFGLLQAEFPVDTVLKTQVIDTLGPLESITMTGSINIGSGYSSDSYSMTIRSGAIIDPGTGRRLWLRFNESAGSAVFADSSLNDNEATCAICPAANEQYASFDRSVTNQRLTVDTAGGNFKTTAFSLGGWVYPTDLNSSNLMQETDLYDLDIVGAGSYAYPRARVYLNGHTLTVAGSDINDVEQNTFNHVIFTFYLDEADTATLKLYLNGELIDTTTYTAGLLGTSSTMVIGDSFTGYLDDIEYYNRVLSEAEIDALVNLPVLDIDFGSLSDLSSTQAAVSCSGDSCPTGDDQWGSFDQLDYVSISDPALDLSGGQFSFATWLKPQARDFPFDPAARSTFSEYLVDTNRDWQGVFGANQNSDSDHYPTLYVSDTGQLWMGFRNNNTDCTYQTAANTVNVTGWNHLTITYNGSRWFVYINGVLKGSSGICAISPPALSSFTIGRPNSQNYFYLDNLHATGLEDAGDCEEIFLDRDGSGIWDTEVCKTNLHLNGPEVDITKTINKGLMFTGAESHSFRLWEDDSWPNPDDIYIDTHSFDNTNLFNGSTAYSDGNSEGELNWSLSNDYFKGELEQFRLYNYTLDQADVTNLYNTTSAGLELTFDEPPGQATFSDSSGNGFSATCSQQTNACPDSGIPGRNNQALRFDGGVADNGPGDGVADYLTVEASTQKLGLYDASFTVMAWVKADNLSGDRVILGTPTRTTNQGLHLILRGGVPYMGFYANDTAGSTTLTPGLWHHLAWVYDKETGTQTIYLDGAVDATETGHAAFTGVGEVEVGRAISENNYFDGLIDDLTIVKRIYSQADVQAAMDQAPFINLHLDEEVNTQSFANDSPYTTYNGTCAATGTCPQAGDKGQIREALVLDGNDALNVSILDEGVFQVNQFSLGMWLNPRTLDTAADMQLFRIWNNSKLMGDVQVNADGDVSFDISSGCWPIYEQFYDEVTGVITENSWQHFMLTNQDIGNDKKIKLYINGQLKGSFTNFGGSCTGPFDIIVGQNLVGNLDELVIYNAVLSENEVAALYDYQNSWYDVAEQHQIIVDADTPAVWLDLYTGHISATTQLLSIGTQDATSPVVNVEYNIDGAGWQSATRDGQSWLFSFDQTGLGDHTVALRATDSVGNSSGTVNETVTVDGVPPTLAVDSSLTTNVQQVSTSLALNGTVSDSQSGLPGSAIQLHLSDRHGDGVGGWQSAQISGGTWTAAYPFPNLRPYGNYNLQITAVDNVGNAITETATLPLDGYGPYADLLLNTTLITQNGVVISGTLSDIRHLPPNQSLHLSFEESSGATEFLDGSRNHFSATCSGAACPTAGQSGQVGQAVQFDGATDALVISGTTAVSVTEHLGLWNDSFTVMAWLNPDTVGGNQAVLGTNTNASNQGLFVGLQDGQPHLGFTNDDTTAPASINSGQWTHLAWRYDHDKGEQAIFVNGSLVISDSGHSGFEGQGPLYVGQALSGNQFDGRIDDLVLYKTAVSADNIYHIANPLDVNVSQIELRFHHAEDRDQADDEGIWYLANPADTGQPFSLWQYSVGANLEGPYRIDLRTTDELGNVALIKDAWTGDFDTKPPRLNFTFVEVDSYSGQVAIQCQAEDYNLTTTGWQCPLTDTYRTSSYLDDLWFAAFGVTDKLVELATTEELVITSSSRSAMTACDLVGHCVTKGTVQKPGGVADNLQLWLKANDGVDTATNGDTITTWLDQSENNYQAALSTRPPSALLAMTPSPTSPRMAWLAILPPSPLP